MMGTAMLVVSATVAVALQSGRIIVSHIMDADALSTYALAMQLYLPVWSLFAASGIALWPIFAGDRSEGKLRKKAILRASAGFCVAGLILGLVLMYAAPWVASIVSGASIDIPQAVCVAMLVMLIVQSSQIVSGMALTDTSGLKFQAICSSMMCVSTVLLGLLLTAMFGLIGPFAAVSISVFAMQIVPAFVRIARTRDSSSTDSKYESERRVV